MEIVNLCACMCIPMCPPVGCVFSHPAVMISLIWAVAVVLLVLFLFLILINKNKTKVKIAEDARIHEIILKDKAFEQEQYWYFQKGLEKDFKKELMAEIEKKEKEKEDLSKKLETEKQDREKELKKERLQAEHDFYEKIINTFYSAKNT